MATLLTKPLTRETLALRNRRQEKMLVTLLPGDEIEFRAKGRRTRYQVPLAQVLNLALIATLEKRYKKRWDRYRRLKAQGQRVKRPKAPPRLWSRKFYQALNHR
jgi:hypothetical protein